MKTLLIAIICIAAGFGIAYMIVAPSSPAVTASDPAPAPPHKQLYTCGMHPEIISDEPGYCPICGMKLTPKKDGGASLGAITIDPATTQNMGLVTTPVATQRITRMVRAFGDVTYDEANIYAVNLRTDGWAEKLYVTYEGETVRKGQPLAEVYSPDLTNAQQEFLTVNRSLKGAESNAGLTRLRNAAETRLQNWDLSEDQINHLVTTGEITRSIKIISPGNGVVTAKKVNEGDRLKAGAEIYRIADLSTVWVKAYIYEQDIPFVKIGQTAQVVFPNLPGQTFEGKIIYISPYLNANRQVEIRLDLDNRDGSLRPDMYAEVSLRSQLPGERVVIPRSAVINSGKRQVVYLALGDGSYSPREVTTGAVGDDDMVEVVSGLNTRDRVVVSGQFMLDSETRLSEALGMGGMHQHGDMASKSDSQKSMDTMPETSVHEAEVHKPITQISDHAAEVDKPMSMDTTASDSLSGIYTCPMPEHYHVLQYGPGKCPECGMALVPIEQTHNTEVYVCPMPEDSVVQDKPGNCPVCGMKLVKFQPGAGHDQ